MRFLKNKKIWIPWVVMMVFIGCNDEDKIPVKPEAKFTITPPSGETTDNFKFDAKGSDPGQDKDKLYFRWDWDNNGTWDEDYTSDPVFMHRYYVPGKYRPVMEALNSSGLTDTTVVPIEVERGYSPPRAMFSVSPASGNRITEFTFDATLTVDDEDSLDQLQFRWDWNGDDIWDTGFSSKSIVKHTFYETGSFHPTLEVKDPTDKTSIYKQNLEVNQTNPNLHVEFTWSPVHPLQEDTVLFDASLCYNPDDPDNELLYYWKFDIGEPVKSSGFLGPFHEPYYTKTFSMEREYYATLKIIDNNSLEKQLTQPVMIYHLNRPPVPDFKIGQRRGNLTTQFYLDAWPTDDIEDRPSQIQVRWDFEGDESWDTEFSIEKYYYHRYKAPGTYRIILEAMDTQGLKDTTSTYVTVTPGTNETGLIIDRRYDAEEFYPTVKIGDQWWTARNMFYEPSWSSSKIDTLRAFCYDYNDYGQVSWKNCMYYGLLYTAYSACDMRMWENVQGICPKGWHIPTRKEWETLIETIGGINSAKELLPGGSTDFNALFAGWGHEVWVKDPVLGGTYKSWEFTGQGSICYFWSSTKLKPAPPAYSHWTITLIKDEDRISSGYSGNANFLSVRCIKNE